MNTLSAREGFIRFQDYRTFYKVIGDLDRIPLGKIPVLAIHGRPVSHLALKPLERLAEFGRPIIFYDQLGCGRSDRPDNPEMWTINLFVEEVTEIRRQLSLDRVHLIGHSWGGVVAMENALRNIQEIKSLILSSTYCDSSVFDSNLDSLRKKLPAEVYETLLRHETAGTTEDPEYKQADKVFILKHVCRVDPWPNYLDQSLEHQPVGKVNTEGWTIRARLNAIDIPTLVTCGRYDFCTPAHAEIIHSSIPGSKLVIFEGSSHYAHIEETDRYIDVLDEFLSLVELNEINKANDL